MIYIFFDKTLKRYGITGKRLAEETGISQGHISDFRNGKTNPPTDTLMRFLDGMDEIAPGSKRYFCQLLAGEDLSPSVEQVVTEADNEQVAKLLETLSRRIRGSSKTKAKASRETVLS